MNLSLRAMRDAPLFAGLDPQARDAVLGAAAVRTYAAGQVLFMQDAVADAFYLVMDGSVQLVQTAPDGREMIVRFIRPAEVIAAVALIPGRRFPVTAIAAEPCMAAVWGAETIRGAVERYPILRANIMAAMSLHMQDALTQGRELAMSRVPQRIAATLIRLVDRCGERDAEGVVIPQPLSREQLAEMTGTTLFTVSRVLSEWQEQGIVATRRRHLVVRDRQRLAEFADVR